MSAAKSVFDTSQLLHDGDCDIMDEYNTVVVGALDMRRKFASIASQSRRLKTELQAKQAEIDHLTTSESPYICWNTRVVACPVPRPCAWMPFLWASFTETLVCCKSKIFCWRVQAVSLDFCRLQGNLKGSLLHRSMRPSSYRNLLCAIPIV